MLPQSVRTNCRLQTGYKTQTVSRLLRDNMSSKNIPRVTQSQRAISCFVFPLRCLSQYQSRKKTHVYNRNTSSRLTTLSSNLNYQAGTFHVLGIVYSDAVSNRHGFMTLKPHRKQHGLEAFTRNQCNRSRNGDLVPRRSRFVKWI